MPCAGYPCADGVDSLMDFILECVHWVVRKIAHEQNLSI
jgi:hypothetical protein